jgi:hypothetical protein
MGVRHLLVLSTGVALVASTCSSPPALASGCWGSGGGGSGSVVFSSGASGSGVGVAKTSSGLNPKSNAILMKQNQFSHQIEKNRRYIMKKDMHLQRRFLHGGFLQSQGPWFYNHGTRCWWRGHTSRWRGTHHGNGYNPC